MHMETTLATPKRRPPYLFMAVLQLVYLVVTAFFEEGVAFFDPIYTTLMSSTEFYLTFFGCLVLFISVVFAAKRFFSINVNWAFLVLFSVLFVGDLVAICLFPRTTYLTGVYLLNPETRLRYIVFWLAACMAFYVFFAIMPKTVISKRQWNVYYLGGLVVAVAAIIYSLFTEWSIYVGIFTKDYLWNLYPEMISFTNNKNTFGVLLMIGIACSLFLYVNTRKWPLLFLPFVFLAELAVIASRTSLICSFIFLVVFGLWKLICSFKSHPIRESFLCFAVVAVFVFLIVAISLNLWSDNTLFSHFYSYVKNMISSDNTGLAYSFRTRVGFWKTDWAIFTSNWITLIFGIGFMNCGYYLGIAMGGPIPYLESSHSGILDIACRQGIIGLLVGLVLVIYFFIIIVKNIKKKENATILYLSFFLVIICHGLFEDTNILNMQTKDMMLLFLSYMPALTDHELSKRSKEEDAIVLYSSSHLVVKKDQDTLILPKLLTMLLLAPVAIVIGLSNYFSTWRSFSLFDSPYFQVQVLVLFVSLPIVIFCLNCQKKSGNENGFGVLLPLSFLFFFFSVLSIVFLPNLATTIIVALANIVLVIVCLSGIKKDDARRLLLVATLYFAFEIVLITFSQIICHFCLSKLDRFQPYAAMCLIILDFLIPIFVLFISNLRTVMSVPINQAWSRQVEDRYFSSFMKQQVRYEHRLIKASKKHITLKEM